MEIALVSSIEPFVTKPGGTRPYVLNLIYNLCDRNIKVTLFGISYGPKEEPTHECFRFVPVAKGKDVSSIKYLTRLIVKTPFYRISRKNIVHAQRPDILFPFTLFKRKNPKVCTMHGLDSTAISKRKGWSTSRIYDFLERFSLKRTDKVIFVDSRSEEWYLNRYPWLKGKTTVIPVGIDTNRFKPMDRNTIREKYDFNPEDRIIIFVGRLEREKRVDVIIEGFKELLKSTDAKLLIVGDGADRQKLEMMADNQNIRFLGTMPYESMPEIMNCANVLVLCSEYEGMPTVVFEAMACGVPVVSTDVGDVSKVVIDGETGHLTTGTPEDLKGKLMMTLERAESYRHNCLEMGKWHSWDGILERILEVYDEVS
jgi:glycosyltransferase involved in cell wall biosynthesis